MQLDLDFVRRQFPALDRDWTYLDNAGGSQVLASVADRVREYLLFSNVQLGASYEPSKISGERLMEAQQGMADFIHARSVQEVVLGPSTTMLLHNLASSLVQTWQPGDEVVVTNCDHEANIGPWVGLERFGIKVKFWRAEEDGSLDLAGLDALMGTRTRLVALTHASNVLGRIHPIAEIAERVHAAGAQICVDGVAYAPHRRVDVRALDVDFYCLSLYKVYGPHEALLYGREEVLRELPGINHFFIGPDEIPYKFQPGNLNYELSYGLLGIWDYLEGLARHSGVPELIEQRTTLLNTIFDAFSRQEEAISSILLDFLTNRASVRIVGPVEASREIRVPTISFVVDGRDSAEIPLAVDAHRIGIRYGDFYARRLIDDLGFSKCNGVVRVSMVHYNTASEIESLVETLDSIL